MNIRICLMAFLVHLSFADCLFRVANYSNYPVKIHAGFYGGESKDLTISNQVSGTVSVSSAYDCYSASQSGTGVVFINLISKKSKGGWRYDPGSGMIRALGKSVKNAASVIGVEPDGHEVALMNNYTPESSVFGVILKPAQFGTSKVGSSN